MLVVRRQTILSFAGSLNFAEEGNVIPLIISTSLPREVCLQDSGLISEKVPDIACVKMKSRRL
jgi:hypothetical protein